MPLLGSPKQRTFPSARRPHEKPSPAATSNTPMHAVPLHIGVPAGHAPLLSHAPSSVHASGVLPLQRCASGRHTPHLPFPLQTPALPQGAPTATGGYAGAPSSQTSSAQGLSSSGG